MRVAVLSDIHGNLEALEAVLDDAGRSGAAEFWSLGDVVGYGPCPAECVEIVRERAAVSLLGNHDAAVVGRTSLDEFNAFARQAAEWTMSRLGGDHREYLRSLPYAHRTPELVLAHASPREPERWHYIHGAADVDEAFAAFGESLCFVGHSHRAGLYAVRRGGAVARLGSRERLGPGMRCLVNAGSVGQPRDRDPRASYVLYDVDCRFVEVRRVAYPVERTQQRMRAAGIAAFLIDRLGAGV